MFSAGMTVIFSRLATKRVRLFPESRNRSRRIRKKLLKRHGGEFAEAPAMVVVGDQLYVHPDLKAGIEAQTTPVSRPDQCFGSQLVR
ncbi:hypothetical protein LOC51_00625 [Rubrivivax sp. JA1024]|nr:hypothetical protein [Rubrivivax sp. JA1024]